MIAPVATGPHFEASKLCFHIISIDSMQELIYAQELTTIGGTSGKSLCSQCSAAYVKMTVPVDLLKVSLPSFAEEHFALPKC